MGLLTEIFGQGKDLEPYQMGARAVVVFLLGIVLVRIAGRRTFGICEPFDNVMKIMLGAILSRAVVGASPFISVISASLVLVCLHYLFGKLGFYHKAFGRLVKGEEKVLYEDGAMNKENMESCMISEKDLLEGVRLNANVDSLQEVKKVYIERNGQISVIKKQ